MHNALPHDDDDDERGCRPKGSISLIIDPATFFFLRSPPVATTGALK